MHVSKSNIIIAANQKKIKKNNPFLDFLKKYSTNHATIKDYKDLSHQNIHYANLLLCRLHQNQNFHYLSKSLDHLNFSIITHVIYYAHTK